MIKIEIKYKAKSALNLMQIKNLNEKIYKYNFYQREIKKKQNHE